MSARKYICTHCDHTFEIGAQDALRCPSCMRQVGLVPVTEGTRPAGPPTRLRLWTGVGLALAAAVGETVGAIEDVHEPYLIQQGYLHRTPRGRVVTRQACEHLDLPVPGGPGQSTLL